jgi:hypothetical protein
MGPRGGLVGARSGWIFVAVLVALLIGLILFEGTRRSPCIRWVTQGASSRCVQYQERP